MTTPNVLDPSHLAGDDGPLRLVLTATLEPVGGLARFQPAGFPEIGHVIYKAPRADGSSDDVCIVDSPASMANHLEAVCLRNAMDPSLHPDLAGLPYTRLLTEAGWPSPSKPVPDGGPYEVVATTLTEGHRLASDLFLKSRVLDRRRLSDGTLEAELERRTGIIQLGKKTHAPASALWKLFGALFETDPNSLVHGVLFQRWSVKIPRLLTAHMEAHGAARVDRSGVKFDRLQLTGSGQPIFAVDDETAREIRATFILDLALLRSFGRQEGNEALGLTSARKATLVALALWKIGRLLAGPFRYRSGCDLEATGVRLRADRQVETALSPATLREIDIAGAIASAGFSKDAVTDTYRLAGDVYKAASDKKKGSAAEADDDETDSEEG